MAGKEAPTRESTKGGANEVLGIGLFALAILFLLALFSYDKGDLLFNGTEVNDPRHNLTGIFGAWLAQGCFLALGVSAYLLPPLTLVFAFGFLINKLEGLRKRWPWALAMILAGSAGLSLYPNLFGGIADQLNTVDAGGYMGMLLNKAIFQHVGTAGATVILLAIYAVSLLYITNFHLKDLLREVWQRWKLRRIDRSQPLAEEEVNLSRKEDELTQRVNELQELQRKLEATQSQVEQTALAAEETVAAAQEDPRIIDLSQPGSRQPGQENESEDQEESVDKSKRQLAAIMFTDIAGYSRMANHDEKAALKLIKKQRRLLKPIVKKFDGEWLKEIGDGLLLSFDSSINAVDCAIAIQEKLRGEPHLDLRIGLHQGDIVRDGKDVLGDGVNIASRIEPYAPIGGVALSEKIQQDLISQPEYDVQLLGEFALEGVDQRVEVYTLNTNSEELEETQLIEPEETVLPPDVVESDEVGPSEELKENLDVAPATSEEVLGVSNPDVDEGTESSVHIAEPVSSTGPLQQPNPQTQGDTC